MIGRDARARHQAVEKQLDFGALPPAQACPAPPVSQLIDKPSVTCQCSSNGTSPAIISDIPSEASISTQRWGGARNSATRTSENLSLEQAANIIAAAQHALAIGMPFNRHLTIHWEQAGIPDERAAWATGRFLKLAGDWIAKQGGRFAWAWVRENGKTKGSHVHILMHVPNGMSLGRMQARWFRQVTGQKRRNLRGVPKTERIGGTSSAARTNFSGYLANLGEVVGYVLKGTDPVAAQELGLERLEDGGRIIGKRAATSQNIGRKARRVAKL